MTTHDRGRPKAAKEPKPAVTDEEPLQGDVVIDTDAVVCRCRAKPR